MGDYRCSNCLDRIPQHVIDRIRGEVSASSLVSDILAMTAEQAPKPKPEPPSELAVLATLVRQIIEAINGNAWMGMAAVRTAKELEAELWNLDQPAK